MFFRRLPPHSIDVASKMASDAIRIAYGYKHNRKYIPTEVEIEKFEQFEKDLWQHYCAARFILRSLYLRSAGMPETEHDWHDQAVRNKPIVPL